MWSSEVVTKQGKEQGALRQIAKRVIEFKDATAIVDEEGRECRFLSWEIRLFQPYVWSWLLLVALFFLAGTARGVFGPELELKRWSEFTLRVIVSVFVLGVSITTVARSLSESARFAAEYLFEVCRMRDLWGVTFGGVVLAFAASAGADLYWFPMSIRSGACSAAVGGTIGCVCMLGFVMLETIRCSVPKGSIHAATEYAARKLCHAFLRSAYLGAFNAAHKNTIEEWCKKNTEAIKPPSEYWRHVHLRGVENNSVNVEEVEVVLNCEFDIHKGYMDFELGGLKKIEKLLTARSAELYLAPHGLARDKAIVGRLRGSKDEFKSILSDVKKQSGRCCKFRRDRFEEVNRGFWKSHFLKLETALRKAIENADLEQFDQYLRSAVRPLGVLREIWRYKIVRETSIETVINCYDILDLYVRALKKISKEKKVAGVSDELVTEFIKILRERIWNEVKNSIIDGDCNTVKLFAEIIPRMYSVISDSRDQKDSFLWNERARFGEFYEFADGLIENREPSEEGDEQMRLVLHEGVTEWLLMAIEKKDAELVKALCPSERRIVFGRGGISFGKGELVARHFVLTGNLIEMAKRGQVGAENIHELLFEGTSADEQVPFSSLVQFYLGNALPVQELDSYMQIFWRPSQTTVNPLTGTKGFSGRGVTGIHEVTRTFIYLAACALNATTTLPVAIAEDMLGRISEDNINQVRMVFEGSSIGPLLGFENLKEWVKQCNNEYQKEEEASIAAALLNTDKVEEYEKKYFEGYKSSIPFLSMCLQNGYYAIDNGVLEQNSYILPKICVIDWKYSVIGGDGYEHGRLAGQYMEKELVHCIIKEALAMPKPKHKAEQAKNAISTLLRGATNWLKKEGCDGSSGIILVLSVQRSISKLLQDENFVPPWKEEVRSTGFDGFYHGFPLIWVRENKEGQEKEDEESTSVKVMAVDFRGWKGIKVREDVVKKGVLGEIHVRMLKDSEIKSACEADKDENEVKSNCAVDVSFFWKFSHKDLPRRITIVAG